MCEPLENSLESYQLNWGIELQDVQLVFLFVGQCQQRDIYRTICYQSLLGFNFSICFLLYCSH